MEEKQILNNQKYIENVFLLSVNNDKLGNFKIGVWAPGDPSGITLNVHCTLCDMNFKILQGLHKDTKTNQPNKQTPKDGGGRGQREDKLHVGGRSPNDSPHHLGILNNIPGSRINKRYLLPLCDWRNRQVKMQLLYSTAQ